MCSGLLEREEKSASAFAGKVPLWKGSWCSERDTIPPCAVWQAH